MEVMYISTVYTKEEIAQSGLSCLSKQREHFFMEKETVVSDLVVSQALSLLD
jgi:hypothetical protein